MKYLLDTDHLSVLQLSRGLTVLTRNLRDFGRVPGLSVEDKIV